MTAQIESQGPSSRNEKKKKQKNNIFYGRENSLFSFTNRTVDAK